ncbi:MAG: alpha/beta hydrolase [Candidatus Dormibacteraeota bacterium]|nr:alpha/beta hydrolase [Candidatus Dormibacteraeota bacterium]
MDPRAGGRMEFFEFQGCRLAYTDYGSGERVLVLVHGQLLSQYMHGPIAEELAAAGHRVVTIDLLGHGSSDRPTDMWRYSMTQFAEQVVGLLDHLGIGKAVVGGTSLGANVSLEFGAIAPERARGLLVEMPVLDAGVFGAVVAFTPLLSGLLVAMPLFRAVGTIARMVPRSMVPFLGNVVLDTMRQDHRSSAAVLQGLFLGRIAPHRDLRRNFRMPVLVIGHHQDPVHPYADADMLAAEVPNARLVEATSILEMRLHPDRLVAEIGRFLDQCWEAPAKAGRGRIKVKTGDPARRQAAKPAR